MYVMVMVLSTHYHPCFLFCDLCLQGILLGPLAPIRMWLGMLRLEVMESLDVGLHTECLGFRVTFPGINIGIDATVCLCNN